MYIEWNLHFYGHEFSGSCFHWPLFSCSDLDMDLHRNILIMGIKQEVMDPLNIRCHHIHGQPLLSTTFNGVFMVDYLNILNIN